MKKLEIFLITAALLVSVRAFAVSDLDRARAISETDRAMRSAETDMTRSLMEPPAEREITAKAWMKLPAGEQKEALIHAMAGLSSHGVVFGHTPEEYAELIRQSLAADPQIASENITNLLASIVYKNEPENSAALASFKRQKR